MKKFVKMSLVAAIAVAGTTASAQPLAEAIKNVDVTGTMVYRYDDSSDKSETGLTGKSSTSNGYKIAVSLKSKVNDDVSANVRIIGAAGATVKQNGDKTTLPTDGSDGNLDLIVTNANFAYTGIANTTVIVGKQGLTTPWTVAVDSYGNEQTGTGILAMSTLGPVTLAGAYFNQTNIDIASTYPTYAANAAELGGQDVYTAGIMGKIGPVSLDAWYLDMDDVFDTYTLGANASFDLGAVTLGGDLRYTSLDLDNSSVDNDMIQATLTAKMGIFNTLFTYAATDSEGGLVAVDGDATTGQSAWAVDINGKADADYYRFVLGAQVLPSLHISANYAQVKYNDAPTTAGNTKTKEDETYAQLTYKMSKNFMGYIRYGVGETKKNGIKSEDLSDKGRLYVKYSF